MATHFRAALLFAAALAWGLPATGLAQSNIDGVNKFSFQENCGWMNWRDAGDPAGAQGVLVTGTFMGGFIWCENIGWINLGDGAPDDGVHYSNPVSGPVTGVPDFGVDVDPDTGELSGFGWGENVGWINFAGGALASPPQPARLDVAEHRLRGYAWGSNIGWLNLDLAEDGKYVVVRACAPDFNRDGDLNPDDLGDYITCFFTEPPCPGADYNGDTDINPDDLGDFITAFFTGCG